MFVFALLLFWCSSCCGDFKPEPYRCYTTVQNLGHREADEGYFFSCKPDQRLELLALEGYPIAVCHCPEELRDAGDVGTIEGGADASSGVR